MKTIKINLFSFDELSNEAQQNAYENWLNTEREFFWGEEAIGSIKHSLDHFGFDLYDYSIDYSCANQSSVSIRRLFDFPDEINNMTGIRLYKYIYNNYLFQPAKYNKSGNSILSGNCPFSGYYMDEVFLDEIRKFMDKPYNITFYDLMNNCIYNCLKEIEEDYEYQNSFNYFAEECEANEIEFTQDGKIW